MSTINRRLFNDLFVKQNVNYNQELYRDAFEFIWPCEKYFKDFLSANEFDVKLDIAKKIYKYYQTNEDTFLPFSLIENLIYLQQHNLITNGTYIPQDHIVHSINLYILGIYIFFNSSLFQSKFLENHNHMYTQNENFFLFLTKWTIFSLYHDVGYVFESLVKSSGYTDFMPILNRYNFTKTEYINNLLFRSLSNIIFDITIISRSINRFDANRELIRNNENWVNINKTSISSLDNVKNVLIKFDGYILLDSINDIVSLSSFFPLIDEESVLVVKDQSNYSCAFLNKKFCVATEAFYYANSNIDYNRILNIDNLIKMSKFKLKCYIKNPKKKITKNLSTTFISDIESFHEKIPENIKTEFSFISNSNGVNRTIHKINRWLAKESNYKVDSNSFDLGTYQMNYSDCLSKVLRSEINKALEKYINSNILTAKKIQDELNDFSIIIKKLDEEKIKKETANLYSQTYGVSSIIFKYLDSIVKRAREKLDSSLIENIFFEIIDNKISLNPLKFDSNNIFAKNVYNNIKRKSTELSIDFEVLKKYHLEYSLCDHGIISASILFEVVSMFDDIVNYSKSQGDIKYCCSKLEDISNLTEEKSLEIYSDSLFSIMIHNVYTKKAFPNNGIEYKHNIDVNPFSYFCALLDVLQKWDRAKSLDFSILDLPDNHYLGQDYDLYILNDEIRIVCNSTNTGFMRSTINDLDEYLPGASSIIKITEFEI